MDEHKTTGMTAFLKREIRAWDRLLVKDGDNVKKRNRKWLMMAAVVVAVAIMAISPVFLMSWGSVAPPAQDGPVPESNVGTQQSGPGESGTEPDAGSEPQTQAPVPMPDPYAYDFAVVPSGATPIVPVNLATKNNPVNQTDRVIDMQDVMSAACVIPAPSGKVSVLVIHTHTGEGYNQDGRLYLDADDEEFARSTDGADGVVAVGARLAQRLNEAGIGTIHCKTVFDGQSNRESYSRAADAIDAFRKAYPSLICVIDVHRAAVIDAKGNMVRSLAVYEGKSIAQTQIICGMSAEHENKTNLALAMLLHDRMNRAFPESCARVVCKEQTLNQDRTPFSMTLEIGSCGNTLSEALAAAEITAGALCTLFQTN